MNYTPKEVAAILANRPHQPHYVEWLIGQCLSRAIADERERCKQAIRDTRDKSGVNSDGQSWLMRASRGDFIEAIDALK